MSAPRLAPPMLLRPAPTEPHDLVAEHVRGCRLCLDLEQLLTELDGERRAYLRRSYRG